MQGRGRVSVSREWNLAMPREERPQADETLVEA